MMTEKQVSGTVILHMEDGSNKFLVAAQGDEISFAVTTIVEAQTGLASFLNYMKDQLKLDVNEIQLVELTNAYVNNKSIPLFVFETEEEFGVELPKGFVWAEGPKVQDMLAGYQLEGMPFF